MSKRGTYHRFHTTGRVCSQTTKHCLVGRLVGSNVGLLGIEFARDVWRILWVVCKCFGMFFGSFFAAVPSQSSFSFLARRRLGLINIQVRAVSSGAETRSDSAVA